MLTSGTWNSQRLMECFWRGHVTVNQARAELGLPPFTNLPEADLPVRPHRGPVLADELEKLDVR